MPFYGVAGEMSTHIIQPFAFLARVLPSNKSADKNRFEHSISQSEYSHRVLERFALKENIMLKTIALVLLVLWAVGFIGFSSAVSGFIHALIVAAVILFVADLLIGGRRKTAL